MSYLAWVRSLDCAVCLAPAPSEAHHAIAIGLGGEMGGKAHDLHAMPVCRDCHMEIHANPWAMVEEQCLGVLRTQRKAIREGFIRVDIPLLMARLP